MIKFHKVSYEQFKNDFIDCLDKYYYQIYHDISDRFLVDKCIIPYVKLSNIADDNDKLLEIYNNIKLPKRATKGSAGYDFYSPIDLDIYSKVKLQIPTGIRVEMDDDVVLSIYPRSGLGSKHRLQLNNTVGIIDSDYYHSDNEGHIMLSIYKDSEISNNDSPLVILQGSAIAQGVFTKYLVTEDDSTKLVRNGGFGSTGV